MTRVSDEIEKTPDESTAGIRLNYFSVSWLHQSTVSVLEFELRKAKEMIRSLREQLTNATSGELVVMV